MRFPESLVRQALDLRAVFPRSPRETLGGYVLAARIVDKARAALVDQLGEYTFAGPNSLDWLFFEFTGLEPEDLKAFVATGATDLEVADWIAAHAQPRERLEIIKWNNRIRDLRLSEAPDFAQEYMEEYIARHVPKHRPVYHYLDIYDLEEGRL